MGLHIFRVVVRGEFSDLSSEVRDELIARADAHDIFLSSYTREGTFTYEPRLHAFSFRFEVREHADDDRSAAECEAAASETALALATAYLDHRGITSKRLRANALDMADMWRER